MPTETLRAVIVGRSESDLDTGESDATASLNHTATQLECTAADVKLVYRGLIDDARDKVPEFEQLPDGIWIAIYEATAT